MRTHKARLCLVVPKAHHHHRLSPGPRPRAERNSSTSSSAATQVRRQTRLDLVPLGMKSISGHVNSTVSRSDDLGMPFYPGIRYISCHFGSHSHMKSCGEVFLEPCGEADERQLMWQSSRDSCAVCQNRKTALNADTVAPHRWPGMLRSTHRNQKARIKRRLAATQRKMYR